LKLVILFIGSYLGHVTFKVTQYMINDFKVCSKLIKVSLKQAQANLQKTITFIEKFAKGLQE
jgi:hypothetical protein